MIPGDGAGGTPAPRPGDGRATHTSPGIEPTAQTKGSELLCQVSLSITRFRTLPTNYVYTLPCKRSFMSYLAVSKHFSRREAAEALKARNSPAQGKRR